MIKKILSNKKAIITGANQGLGLEIARKFVLAGADLMICARNGNMLEDARNELIKLASAGQKIEFQTADISLESDAKKIVDQTLKLFGGCHILVNNAGIYGPKGETELVDWRAWTKTIEINLYGSILMSREIMPHFKKKKYGKIIQLSGGGATSPLPFISAYAVSKAAIIRFSETLAEEVRGTGIDINAIAPGALNTQMLEEILLAGPKKVGQSFYNKALEQKKNGGAPLQKAADLALFLASSDSDGITSKLISAVWDKWEDWPKHLDELTRTDAYTIRRIIGRDRGFKWGDK
jgi:NAD(P)-dependent dehydrogenase (short-subunit alcohol dehydrogenase family)